MGIRSGLRHFLFGYDATETTGRRRVRPVVLRNEDDVLDPKSRKRLISDTTDLRRNYSIARWAISKHLDYTSVFSFQCRTGNRALDERIEALMDWWSRPLNCDVTGRHSLQRLTRLSEGLRTVQGDMVVLKMSDGRVQLIEGDRIRTPNEGLPASIDPGKLVHGVEVTPSGRASRYIICDRAGGLSNKFTFKAAIPARYTYCHGVFDRYDQVRGVSPLASAINAFSDVYEASEYALAKAKVSQLFGIKFKRAADTALTETESDTGTGPTFNFGRGPQVLDLDPGDDAEFMESRTPSTEFATYMDRMIAVALKSLDIPYSFFNEAATNYSGARQALLMYEQSAKVKRGEVRELLNQLTAWRLQLFIDDGVLVLPAGMTVGDLKWEWISSGIPWIDPLKEASADIALVQSSLRSRQEISKERGRDWFSVVDELAAEEAYLKEKNIVPATPAITIGVNTDASN